MRPFAAVIRVLHVLICISVAMQNVACFDPRVIPESQHYDDPISSLSPVERVQRFWDQRPCNFRHSSKEPGTREYFVEVEQRKYAVEPHVKDFAMFKRWNGKRVLDIGAGLGTESINFARAGAILTVIELSARSLNLTRVRFAHEGLSANFILGDAGEVDRLLGPAMQGQFDLIWCWGVLHHMPSPEKVIQRLRLYIRPQEGEFRFMVYSRVSYKLFETMHRAERWSMDPGVTRPLLAWNSEAQRGSPITHTYTMAQVRHELLPPSDQWEILDVRKRHIFIWQVEEYTRGRLVKDLAWQGVSDEYLSDLEAELGWHTCVVARFTPKSSSTNAEL